MTTGRLMPTGGCIKCRKLERVWLHYYCGRTRLSEKQVYNKNGYCSEFEPKETAENQTKKMTNADRIRSMSDEDLADFLCQIVDNCDTGGHNGCSQNCPLYECCCDQPSDNIEDWLKAEYKGKTE